MARQGSYELYMGMEREEARKPKRYHDQSIGSEWWNLLTPEKQENVMRARYKLARLKCEKDLHTRPVKLIDDKGHVTDCKSIRMAAHLIGVTDGRVQLVAKQNEEGTRDMYGGINKDHKCGRYRVYYADDVSWVSRKNKSFNKARK